MIVTYNVNSASGSNCVIHEHEDIDQYGSYAIPSEVLPCYSYHASLVNQFEILIDPLC